MTSITGLGITGLGITRQGWLAIGAGAVSILVARVFGVLELFVIGVGFFAAVAVAWAIVVIRRPRLRGGRWIHPMVMVAGDVGRVDIRIEHVGTVPSVSFELSETVGRPRAAPYTARLPVPPMAARAFTITGYELTTTARGIVRLGPLIVEHRDPLGLARTLTSLLDVDEVFVAPRSYLVDMPQLGQGILGAHLLAMARRLGPGEFHGLREYVDGDEPRSIHWKASARSEQLLVKEFTTEGLRRCTVVLDATVSGYGDPEAFERAVTVAASLVHSADRAGLTTRFVTVDGIDLRGPDVAQQTLRHLARLELSSAELGPLEHDPGEGLGLLIAVGAGIGGFTARIHGMLDPTQTAITVSTERAAGRSLDVAARSDREFIASWNALLGRGRLDVEARS